MNEPSDFWVNLLPNKGDEQKPASERHDYCRYVLDLLASHHPDLYSGQAGATLTLNETQALVDKLQKNTLGHIFKYRVNYLIRGLEKGTLELDWNVAIPQPPLVIPRDKPRFTLENFTTLPDVHAVKSAFLKNLKQSPPETYTNRVGQLLLSAILFGGLVRKRWLAPWVEALPSVRHAASMLWTDMALTPVHLERERRASGKTGKTKPDHSNVKETWEIRQRWFADPLTHALVLRWYKDFPDDLKAGRNVSPLLAVRQYLDQILQNPKKTSESFVLALLHGSATRMGLGVPSYLLAYAEEINKSVSLSSVAWERLLTGKCIISSRKDHIEDNDEVMPVAELLPVPEARHIAVMANQEKMLKEILRNILPPTTTGKRKASDSREALQIYYKENHTTMCQSLSCLVLWCIDLLTHYNRQDLIRGRVKSSIRASSVRRYLEAIGKRLIAVANNEGILGLESDELHDLYREVIDICPTDKSKNTAGTRLHGFHQFLCIRLGAPSVDFSDLGVKSGPAELGVNANLFSFYSFDQMKKVLCPNYSKATRMRKMQFLLSIIAFRCGLREMEALKLRIIDLQGDTEPELFVRTNRYAYVKSSESIRRLPLACLLEEDELKLLLAWRRDRILEDGISIPESLLFCLNRQPTVLLPKHEVFPTIVQAIRQVTGDENLVFHHFRHSFATWMLLRLLKNFSPETRRRFHFLSHHCFDPSNCGRLRKAILGNHMLGRQALFATAQLCGHAGPEVTLLHYIHLCDWLLGIELAVLDNQPILDVTTIKAITGLPQHILYYDKNIQKDISWHMSLFLEKLPIPNKLKPECELHRVDTRRIPEKTSGHPDSKIPLWLRVISVIREHQMSRLPFDTLAARSGVAVDDVRSWCINVELLASMKTKRGNPRHLNGNTHRKNPDFRFPNMRHEKESKIIAEIILNVFETSSGRKKQDIIKGVRDFIACFSVGESGVPCQTHGKVKIWIRFLTSLDVPLRQIHVVRILPRKAKNESETVQNRLAVRFGLPESSVTVRSLYPAEYSRTGAYCVQVKNSKVDKNGKLNGNYGFRFAMYMIAIMAGLE